MFSLLFLISMIDFKTYYIPIDLLLSFIIMGFFFGIINNNENIFLLKHEDFTIRLLFEIDIFSRFFGLIVSFFVLFGLIFFFTSFFRKFKLIKKTNFVMGLADPLFFAGIISFFGLNKIPIILFLSSAQGFIYFILCNLWNKFFSKKKCFIKLGYNIIPLAPFLSIASLELILFF
jgi:prepilin signal peptidase PulO-like enzyme (type II secretory pathway)